MRYDSDDGASFTPTPVVNAACACLVFVAALLFLLMARLLIATRPGFLALAHGVVGLGALGGAVGVRSGRLPLTIVGLVACPLAGLGSLFALFTGSIAGLGGGALSAVTMILTVIALGDVAKMGAARRALNLSEPPPVSVPLSLSGELLQVKPRRWPVVAVLLAIVVVGGGGLTVGLRLATRQEAEREAKAFAELETCVLGARAGATPRLAYRRMEIVHGAEAASADGWPGRCAKHAHAIHESKRRVGASASDVRDLAFFAERLGHVLVDPREASVYDAVDDFWREAAKEGHPYVAGEPSETPWLDLDRLERTAPLSTGRIRNFHVERGSVTPAHLLDGTGKSCTFDGATARCTMLPSPLDRAKLDLLGAEEGSAAPLLFANHGEGGIYRPDGTLVGTMWSFGGYVHENGSTELLAYDDKAAKFALWRAPKKRALFKLKGVSDNHQLAVLDGQLFWTTDDGALSTARLMPAGAALGAKVDIGSLGEPATAFESCRTPDAFFVHVRTAYSSSIAVESGGHWSSLHRVNGSLYCSGKEALFIEQADKLYTTRCTFEGCSEQALDLDEVFRNMHPEALPERPVLALPVGGKLLIAWRAGQRAGVRMRFAPVDRLATTEDVVLFDDRVQNQTVGERTTLGELAGWVTRDRAIVFLSTKAGIWAVAVDENGKFEVVK